MDSHTPFIIKPMAESNSPNTINQKLFPRIYVKIATATKEFPIIRLILFPNEFISTVAGIRNSILNIGYVDSAKRTSAALIPLAPGGGIYYTMLHLLNNQYKLSLLKGAETLVLAGAMALGVIIGMSFSKIFFRLKKI